MLVQARNLGKDYGTQRGTIAAVDGLDLELTPGEFLAICGRSGSGKSTLLGMLGGLCRPTRGTVQVDGVDLWTLGRSARAQFRGQRLGFLFQFAGLLPNLRAADNIALPALLAGLGYQTAYARARDLLGQVGLSDRWDAYPGELSGGQQRRIAIARALVNQPILLLADEPTNDLDEESEEQVVALLRQLQKKHDTTLVVVTHNMELAHQADRVINLRGGKLVSTTTPEPMSAPALQPVTSAARVVPAASDPATVPEAPLPCTRGRGVGVRGLPFGGENPLTPNPSPPSTGERGGFRETLSAPHPSSDSIPMGEGLGRFLLGFLGWALVIVCLLWGVDFLAARFQHHTLQEKQTERKKVQELALQHLRADVDSVAEQKGGGYEFGMYLQNYEPNKPIYVLGPVVRVFVQVKQNWQEVPITPVGFSENSVREVRKKEVLRFAFRADLPQFDELLKGYMHIRISNVMVISESAEPTNDIFQRTDEYFLYLKPQNISEAEVRKRNGWKENSLVPRWMAMPAH